LLEKETEYGQDQGIDREEEAVLLLTARDQALLRLYEDLVLLE
jgi:hypothetical protein